MAGLQNIFKGFFQTEVVIEGRTSDSNSFSDDEEIFGESRTVMGWMRNQPDTQLVTTGGAVQAPQTGRLFLPIGTEIHRGDRLTIKGDKWIVIDHNAENTYRVALRVAIERLG